MKEKNLPLSVGKWVLLAVILFFLLFPLYWVLVTSFKTNMEAYRAAPTFFPDRGELHQAVHREQRLLRLL